MLMKLGVICSPLGGSQPPFGHSRKEAWVLPVVMAASAVFDGVMNSVGQNSANNANMDAVNATNATNLQISRETNAMSQKQFDDNMQWAREQFASQREYALEDREYNSIQNQVKRALAAGINPSAVVGNGSAAHSTIPVSSVGLPSQSNFQAGYAQAGHVEPVEYDFTGLRESVGHAMDAYYENRLKQANTRKTNADAQTAEINNLTQHLRNMAELRKTIAQIDSEIADKNTSEAQRDKLIKEKEQIQQFIDEQNETFGLRKQRLEKGNALLDKEGQKIDRDIEHIDFEERLEESRLQIEAALAKSQIGLNSAQQGKFMEEIRLIGQQVTTEVAKGNNISADTIIKRIEAAILKVEEEDKSSQHDFNSDSYRQKVREVATYVKDILFTNVPFGASVGSSSVTTHKVP